jgi:hypothetical protein
LIDNLPQDGVVEVACLVDNKGIQPTHFGKLPTQMALLNQQHVAFHDLTARAVLENDREAAVHALMVDPLTAAVCSLAEIRRSLFSGRDQADVRRNGRCTGRLSARIYYFIADQPRISGIVLRDFIKMGYPDRPCEVLLSRTLANRETWSLCLFRDLQPAPGVQSIIDIELSFQVF